MKNAEFEPLFRAVAKLGLSAAERERLTSQYVFMYLENGVYAYKHSVTRHYVYLDELGVLQAGGIEPEADDASTA
ncbi:hypothetical protein SAMN02799624_04930 [Paenibacillus sp. UNC496MF]|uniref:hypothetical protein n=1 Tax=Paenibacillus sp. UNC496MF TaxID=1502753 RepID=UPI0008EFE53B|nr:hypothetical protein [Paenibacillus sp. UNC496MF]SFJ54405.1 hypothetical protein SAMN02799624_04930 [Paenibacillus sp. UNC496MF]